MKKHIYNITGFIVFFMFIMLLSSAVVNAAVFSASFTAVDNDIYPNETAVFDLSISNFQKDEKVFQIYTVDPQWALKTDPLRLAVPPESAKKFKLYVTPRTGIPLGSQGVMLTVKELESQEILRSSVIIGVRSPGIIFGQYVPNIGIDVDMPSVINPREPVVMDITLKNRNNLDLKNTLLTIYSSHFSKEEYINISPLGEQKVEYTFNLNPLEEPTKDSLEVRLRYSNDTISRFTKAYDIGRYSDVKEEVSKSSFLFRSKRVFTLTNKGNIVTEYNKTVKKGFFEGIFMSTDPDAETVKTPEGKVKQWIVSLEPGESQQVVLVVNYNILVLILLLILIGIFAYYKYRSPIVSIKELIRKGGREETAITVKLFIKNRTGKIMEAIHVVDKVPSIADIVNKESPGSISPKSISRNEKRTLLRWHLEMLEPYEERILSYRIKSRLNVVGRLTLPPAKISFRMPNGNERVVFSSIFDKGGK